MAEQVGTGIFARELTRRFSLLPVEEEGRLHDAQLRENFLERIFTYRRWTEMLEQEPTVSPSGRPRRRREEPGGLVRIHTAHKLTLMTHSPRHYAEMGRLVAEAGVRDWDPLAAEYAARLMDGLPSWARAASTSTRSSI